jgi:hypothetical protein
LNAPAKMPRGYWRPKLGGNDLLSEGQRQLIRRAATLSVMAEAVEADVVRDMGFDVLNYGTVCDRLRRILESLGLQRVARTVEMTPMQRLEAHKKARREAMIDG